MVKLSMEMVPHSKCTHMVDIFRRLSRRFLITLENTSNATAKQAEAP